MGAGEMDWNDAAIAELRTLWAEGHSAAVIGWRLGASKNSIIGKAHRIGLPARPSPIRRGDHTPPPRSPRLHPAVALPALLSVPDSAPVVPTARQLHGGLSVARVARPAKAPPIVKAPPPAPPPRPAPSGKCAWPTWSNPADPAYRAGLRRGEPPVCGAPVRVRTDKRGQQAPCVYCAEHAAIAFTKRLSGYATDGMLSQLAAGTTTPRKEF